MKSLSTKLSAFRTSDALNDIETDVAEISASADGESSNEGDELSAVPEAAEAAEADILEQNPAFMNIDAFDSASEEPKKSFDAEPENDDDLLAYFNS